MKESTRKKLSESKKGKNNPMWGKSPNKAQLEGLRVGWEMKKPTDHLYGNQHAKGKVLGEDNANWRGDRVSYSGLHKYIKRHKPKTTTCEECRCTPKRLELSKVHGAALRSRNVEDYRYLCVKCHRNYDKEKYREASKRAWETRKKVCKLFRA